MCEEGAAEVLGLDVSENMLARARADTSDAAIRYAGADLEAFTLPAAAFDLAYSSLTFHYIADLGRLFASIHQALVPGGRLVFSIEHPIFMVPTHPVWSAGTDGRAVWPLDGYLAEGQRVTEWFAPGVIKYHRTLGTTLNLLIGSGFSVRHIEEWGPTEAQIAAKPEWVKERERPMFLIIAAER